MDTDSLNGFLSQYTIIAQFYELYYPDHLLSLKNPIFKVRYPQKNIGIISKA